MRPTTNSEKFLLALLALILLGGAAYFGYGALAKKQHALDFQRASLQADNAEAAVDLLQVPLWTTRAAWIKAHEPAYGDEGDTRVQVENFAVKTARDHHLEIQEQNLGDVQHGPGGARVNAEIRLRGSMESLCRWLAALQNPSSFYAVQYLSLKADADQKSMDCTVRVSCYFKEPGK